MKSRLAITLLLLTDFCMAQVSLAKDSKGNLPHIQNAKLETVVASTDLRQQIETFAARQTGTAWVAYAVPAVASHRTICCFDGSWEERGCCGACRLESEHNTFSGSRDDCPDFEQKDVAIFYRVEEKKVDGIRLFTENCQIDAVGLPVTVITGVDPKQSVTYLSTFITETDTRMANRALDAIAEHADPAADAVLDRFVAADQPEKIREHAAFWLGVARGQHGYVTLKRLIESDPDDRFREKTTFPLSQSPVAEAEDELIHVAKQDSSSRVRGKALFWLAQKAGKKVAGTITDAIENDPDTDVKKKAVFALSQMPDHEGVPKLIEVAKNNRNPVVRKQAVFWLGQSNDPRALDFITSVLVGNSATGSRQ
jgi:HEAT repeat protein